MKMVVDINDAFDYSPPLCRAPRQKKGGKPDLVRTGPSAPKRNTRRVRSVRETQFFIFFKLHPTCIHHIHIMTVADLPQLPLVCLRTADSKDTQQVISGKPTIIGTSALVGTNRVGTSSAKSSCRPPTGGWRVVHHPQRSTQKTHYPSSLSLGIPFRLLDDSVYPMSGCLGQAGSDGGRPQVRKCPIH